MSFQSFTREGHICPSSPVRAKGLKKKLSTLSGGVLNSTKTSCIGIIEGGSTVFFWGGGLAFSCKAIFFVGGGLNCNLYLLMTMLSSV